MPRKPDMPCAECGNLMWRGKGVLPEGQATCTDCRSKRPGYGQGRPLTSVTTWDCQTCGKLCERKPTKGQRPKYCSQRCSDLANKGKPGTCAHCGAAYFGHGLRYCSKACDDAFRAAARPVKQLRPIKHPRPRVDQRRPLRVAYEAQDWPTVLSEMRQWVSVNLDGCWIWQRRIKDGYPVVIIGDRHLQAHRVTLEASLDGPLGSQPAHHICAETRCVNPDHLVPVTHAQNVAEMLARNAYRKRIAELEAALVDVAPTHPLLSVLPLY